MTNSLEIFGAAAITINTPDGPVELRASMTPVQFRRASRLLDEYRRGIAEENEPDWPAIFALTAEVSGFSEDTIRAWGHIDAVRLLDFFVGRWGPLLVRAVTPTTKAQPSPSPSASPRRSKAQSR